MASSRAVAYGTDTCAESLPTTSYSVRYSMVSNILMLCKEHAKRVSNVSYYAHSEIRVQVLSYCCHVLYHAQTRQLKICRADFTSVAGVTQL